MLALYHARAYLGLMAQPLELLMEERLFPGAAARRADDRGFPVLPIGICRWAMASR